MNILMLPTLHESRLLHKKKFCSLGNFSGSGSWRMFCNGLDTMYMYKNLMCVVCTGLLSDEFPTGRLIFWKARDLNQFLKQESWRTKQKF